MRIICDHCSRPISGTVKSGAGNFNLHPDCLAQLDKQAKESNWGALAEPGGFSQRPGGLEENRNGRSMQDV